MILVAHFFENCKFSHFLFRHLQLKYQMPSTYKVYVGIYNFNVSLSQLDLVWNLQNKIHLL